MSTMLRAVSEDRPVMRVLQLETPYMNAGTTLNVSEDRPVMRVLQHESVRSFSRSIPVSEDRPVMRVLQRFLLSRRLLTTQRFRR